MTRKITNGPVRNKERTKATLINALGKILKKKGFAGLSASSVAGEAKVDRRLIYDYFGDLEGLVKEYLNNKDYWKMEPEDVESIVRAAREDAGKALAYGVLQDQLDSLIGNEEMRRIITWGLSEKSAMLKELDLKRENVGEMVLSEVFDKRFADSKVNFRAVYALLMGGVYYLTLHAKMQENTFCGIDIQQPAGQDEIKKTIRQLLDLIYK
ncbi:TetR/AcrR family transcriptional regulator [Mucilaginibacter auburnensis]|uniref:Regulatory TetR family protein n=1 Tax=Mucilaginibacter auburnensis TaxID=1457233 RepID=A0A2H9VUD8_9SPHI|nr:TetR/AcrR family transcriptional regulator [Mucilaginibacter auburnensis]PJJ84434.1 regulatory TetR family protein [Mucilaginibacter auburnensis]